ncbi:MAG: hypothetical protein OEV78_05875, partial [Spirochaetia bacterium]|nr:hypothetical protein [Spirochaetia bacterium]
MVSITMVFVGDILVTGRARLALFKTASCNVPADKATAVISKAAAVCPEPKIPTVYVALAVVAAAMAAMLTTVLTPLFKVKFKLPPVRVTGS